MARVAAYSTLYPFLVPELPGCPTHLILQALQQVGRDFCRITEAWHEELDSQVITDYQQDYVLSHAYNAEIQRIRRIYVNASEQAVGDYSLEETDTLRFATSAVPSDLDNQVLVCAAAGTSVIATWNAITDGSVKITVDDSVYSLEDLDFSSDADMDTVALTIQTALRDAIDSNTGFVRWHDKCTAGTEHFAIWTDSGTVSYLTAGASGTDISGASYMNGLTGAGSLGGHLEADVVLRPHISTLEFPTWFLDRWGETIQAGALARLASQKKKPWSDAILADQHRFLWNSGITKALGEKSREYKSEALDFD